VAKVQIIQNPDTFIEQAIAQGAGVDVLSGLFDLKQKWEAAEAKKSFDSAMLKFQSLKPILPKTSDVTYGKDKVVYKFCPLEKMEELLQEPLAECELSYRWEAVQKKTRDGQRCVITHVMGHSESNTMFAPPDDSGNKNKIQAIGSSSTYLQRYTLVGALGLTTSDTDDDGFASGEMPYLRLLEHNEALRDGENLKAVLAIKEALEENEYEIAAMYLYEMGKEVATALWVAPTKGGIFTTEEIKKMKSNEYHAARTAYFESKGKPNEHGL